MPDDTFFSHLRVTKTFHIIISAETDDFDSSIARDWGDEGFDVTYVPFGDGGADYVRKVQAVADKVVGVSEQYAIVSFGSPGSPLLLSLRHLPRLAALIAYYPPQIPSTQHITQPPSVLIQMHLCASHPISVSRRPEILGLAGSKIKTTTKTVEPGSGLGGALDLGDHKRESYAYDGVGPGFAEPDADAFAGPAAELARARALRFARAAFALPPPDLERVRDAFTDALAAGADGWEERFLVADGEGPGASRLNLPTLTGGFDRGGLRRYYDDLFAPTAAGLRARLLGRTVGATQVVDEVLLTFKHDAVVEWLLPGVPPTGKVVKIVIVSVLVVRGKRVVAERCYWDQASVLVQIGMLDPALVAKGFAGGEHKNLRMPVVGMEQADAVEQGEDWGGSVNGLLDAVKGLKV